MDDMTFGSSTAAVDLARELETNYPFLIGKVSSFILKYRKGFQHIKEISDRRYKIRFGTMWRHEFTRKINFDPGINSFVNNLLVADYRNFLTEIK